MPTVTRRPGILLLESRHGWELLQLAGSGRRTNPLSREWWSRQLTISGIE